MGGPHGPPYARPRLYHVLESPSHFPPKRGMGLMTNLDLDKVRKLTRRYDELPPVEIRPPRWYRRPSVWILLILLGLACYLAVA